MFELAPKREMEVCRVSECPNMFLDNESCAEDTSSSQIKETILRGITPASGLG